MSEDEEQKREVKLNYKCKFLLIIFKYEYFILQLQPRQYQLELLNYVCERNAIIYLPTGAGKTFIAILALKHFSSQMKE